MISTCSPYGTLPKSHILLDLISRFADCGAALLNILAEAFKGVAAGEQGEKPEGENSSTHRRSPVMFIHGLTPHRVESFRPLAPPRISGQINPR